MNIDNIDLVKVGKVLLLGVLVWALSAIALWSGGAEWMTAVKVACGVTVGWISGNLADTGMIIPSKDAISK